MYECNQARCYGWQDNRKMQNKEKMKCMQGYLNRLRRCQESIEKNPTSMDRESVEDVSSRQRAQDFGLMDRPICREAIKVKPKNLDRRGICLEAIEDAKKRFFKGEKHIRWESNKMATQTSIQATC